MYRRLLFLVLAAIAVLPTLIFAAVMVVRFNDQQQQAIEIVLRQSARSALQAVDRQITDNLAALNALAASPRLDDGDLAEFHIHAQRVLQRQQDWLTVRLAEAATGRTLIDLQSPAGADPRPTIDPGEIEAVVRTRQPLIGGVRRNTSIYGEPFVVLRVPVVRGGVVRYVLSAALRASAFSGTLIAQSPPASWTIAVLDQSRTIVGRNRAQNDYVGVQATATLADQIERANENFFFALNQEGDRVYTAFSQSPLSGWTVAVGAPGEEVEGPLRRSLLAAIGGGTAAFVLAVLLSALLFRNFALRREAEQKLHTERATERRLSDIAANFPGIIYRRVLHVDGRLSYPYIGGDAESLVGDELVSAVEADAMAALTEQIAPEDRGRWRDAVMESAATLAPYDIEGRLHHQDGSLRWVRSIANAHRRDDGAVVWDGVVFDITALKVAEAALRRSEARTRAIVDAAADGIVTINEQGIIESFNPAAERIFGYAAAEVVGQDIKILMPASYRVGHESRLRHYVTTGEARIIGRSAEVQGLRKDGSVFPMDLAIGEAIVDGRRLFAGIVRDVTERKRAEEALRIDEERLRLAIQATNLGTWDQDLLTGELIWSERCRAIFGVADGEEVDYAQFLASIHPDDREIVERAVARALDPAASDEINVEFRTSRTDGGMTWVSTRGLAIFAVVGGERRAVRLIGTVRDVTDRKLSEMALTAALAEKETLLEQKDTLLREVHHRVKNNLQVVHSLIQLERAGIESDQARERLDTVSQRIHAMGRLHEQLYASGNLAKIDFGDYLRELCGRLADVHARDGVAIDVEADEMICDLDTAVPLGLIANELVSNSFKHAFPNGRGGHVQVRLRRLGADGAAELVVADNGIGTAGQPNPGRGGIGSRLIQALARQLRADMRVETGPGMRTTIRTTGSDAG